MQAKPPLKIGLTIHYESHPEWYELLSSISNGKTRAELIRGAMGRPRKDLLARLSKKEPASAVERPGTSIESVEKPKSIEQKIDANSAKPTSQNAGDDLSGGGSLASALKDSGRGF